MLQRFEIDDPLHGAVPCASLTPDKATAELPLVLFLYGGGGSREMLADLAPTFEDWWTHGALPLFRVATPDVGPLSFYLDDPARGLGWESFITQRFVPSLHAEGKVGVIGISMGGYGALKLAFSHTAIFSTVAAISPMIEPSLEAKPVRARNRYFYPPDVPQALLGRDRDAELYRRDHPAQRARANAETLRRGQLAILIDASGNDALHAHDGAEFLHRLLWDENIPHDYRLQRDADHVGPDLPARIEQAFTWTLHHLQPPAAPVLDAVEREWQAWLDSPEAPPPTAALPASSPLSARVLRAQLAPARREAALLDPTIRRRNGVL